jgi:hypothetical protein
MPLFERRRFERARGGGFRVRLPRAERAVLETVRAELELRLDEDPDDPELRRLFPPASDDAGEAAEYRHLTHGSLLDGRRRALAVVRDTLERERLSADEAEAWLTVLNDARLVLGTRLDVREDALFEPFDARDPRAREQAVYVYLSWLQEQLVEAMLGSYRGDRGSDSD